MGKKSPFISVPYDGVMFTLAAPALKAGCAITVNDAVKRAIKQKHFLM